MIDTSFSTWKRYRGGMAPDIWVYDLEAGRAEVAAPSDAYDSQPMWHGSVIYFVSDRDESKRDNLWAYDTETKTVRQVTYFTDSDVHFPSIGPGDIVFEREGRLYLLDLATERTSEVQLTVVTDRNTLRPRSANVSGYIRNSAISPTGKRVLFEARGEIFSVPVEHGVTRNLTESSGVAERFPAWSPDGKWVAYFSDRTGEYELTLRPAEGNGAEQQLTHLGAGFRYQPHWSPDSKKIAFVDNEMQVMLHDLVTHETYAIDHEMWAFEEELMHFTLNWSADSRWLAYAADQANRQSAIMLYDSHDKECHLVTRGYYDDDMPVFDPEGKYLYYRSKRNFDPIYGDVDHTWIYANGQVIVAVPLQKETASPMAPRDDEEPIKGEKTAAEKHEEEAHGDTAGKEGADAVAKVLARRPKPVTIDLDGFESRGVVLPPAPGRFGWLDAVPGKVLFAREPRAGSDSKAHPLSSYDLEKRDEKLIVDDAPGVDLSADGRRLLIERLGIWRMVSVSDIAKIDKTVSTTTIEMVIDPPAEWLQLFDDAWRIERDFFYDPGLHGVDWKAVRDRYGRLLADCVTRSDVNHVLGEMLGELNVSHAYRGGGDLEDAATERTVGYLGCDFTLDQGAYRISRILTGAPWDIAERSPLLQPGLKVKEGDWLLAVNGRPIDVSKDPWAAFQGLGERTVYLTVNERPKIEGSHEILVHTLSNEASLRQSAWIEQNRLRVERASAGQIGYIYVLNTATEGQNQLVRQFRAQVDKPGLIIDERWNSGGQIPDRFVELLGRKVTNYWAVRDGRDWQTPRVAHAGAKAMLVNGWSGSGGDCFPWLFRQMELGPIIGERTWGGLIGMTGAPKLIDGGHVTVPTFAIYDRSGKWIIEGHGVDPDIEVLDDPAQLARGVDPQLERAIEEVKNAMKSKPAGEVQKPEYPKR
jgi:tricorn protease